MHFERRNASQNAYNYTFLQKKKIEKKYVCLPDLKFSDPLPETHLFFIWPYSILHDLLLSADFFQNHFSQKIISGIPSQCQTAWLITYQTLYIVWPDLGPYRLQLNCRRQRQAKN